MIHIRDECTLCYIYLSFVGGIKGMDNNTWNGRMLIITVVKHDDDQWSRESPELRKIKYIYISNILRFDLWLVARAFSSFFLRACFFLLHRPFPILLLSCFSDEMQLNITERWKFACRNAHSGAVSLIPHPPPLLSLSFLIWFLYISIVVCVSSAKCAAASNCASAWWRRD